MGFLEYQTAESSEKIGLVRLEAAHRPMGWVLESGTTYKVALSVPLVVSVFDQDTEMNEAASVGAMTPGDYFWDRQSGFLYAKLSGGGNPNARFLAVTRAYFFSNVGIALPHDLSTGYDVNWLPLLKDVSEFELSLDNQNQIGQAIEGSGSVKLYNDKDFWGPIYDKLYFENQSIFVYSFHRDLAASDAKLIFKGKINTKSWSPKEISFGIKDQLNVLRNPIATSPMGEIAGARLSDTQKNWQQRVIYGRVNGHKLLSIDQVLDGYPLTGTLTPTNNSKSVTGTGTAFLAELSPGDQITFGDDEDDFTVESVQSDTALTLSDDYEGVDSGAVSSVVKPEIAKRWINREFFICGHTMRRPSTTVTASISANRFEVADVADFQAGDEVLVNGERSFIRYITGNTIKLRTNLVGAPTVGFAVTRPPVQNVRLGTRALLAARDYSFDADTGRLTLDPLAEFNVAPIKLLTGTVTFTNGSRNITGSGTFFNAELAPGDWIRASGQAEYFEILQVTDESNATLRTASTYNTATIAYYKHPEYYDEDSSVLSADVLGKTSTGLTTGSMLETAPSIVKSLLTDAGLGDLLNVASFTAAESIAQQKLGISLPEKQSDTKAPVLRDVINKINQSVFGSLVQNQDFQLEYQVLRPRRADSYRKLNEKDILSFTVKSDSSRIAKSVKVYYDKREVDPISLVESEQVAQRDSKAATYLAQTEKVYEVKTYLTDPTAAQNHANRFGLILEVASSIVELKTKLQTIDVSVTEPIQLDHEKMYERTGSASTVKFAAVQSAARSFTDSKIELEDLANAYTRTAVIAQNTATAYVSASDLELNLYGYITDEYGMIANEASTHNVNLIF